MTGCGGEKTGGDPAVSVVIPVRDGLTDLPAAIASVELQGGVELELLVIDDGSSDGTSDWLASACRSAPRMTVLRTDREGLSEGRNRAIAVARAPLVAFLDPGDVWLPNKLGPQLAFHTSDPQLVFSFTDYLEVGPNGQGYGSRFDRAPAFRRLARTRADLYPSYQRLDSAPGWLLAESVIRTSTVVAKRDALQAAGAFDTSLRSVSEWDLWLRLALAGPVAFTTGLGARGLQRSVGEPSSEARVRAACIRWILAQHAPEVLARCGAAAVRRGRANLSMAEAELARLEGRYRTAAMAHLRALFQLPSLMLSQAVAADMLRASMRSWEKGR